RERGGDDGQRPTPGLREGPDPTGARQAIELAIEGLGEPTELDEEALGARVDARLDREDGGHRARGSGACVGRWARVATRALAASPASRGRRRGARRRGAPSGRTRRRGSSS